VKNFKELHRNSYYFDHAKEIAFALPHYAIDILKMHTDHPDAARNAIENKNETMWGVSTEQRKRAQRRASHA
jgi:hypothetical protein